MRVCVCTRFCSQLQQAFAHTGMCTLLPLPLPKCTRTHTPSYMHASTHARTNALTHKHTPTCMRTHNPPTYMHASTHARTHTYTCTYTQTHTCAHRKLAGLNWDLRAWRREEEGRKVGSQLSCTYACVCGCWCVCVCFATSFHNSLCRCFL